MTDEIDRDRVVEAFDEAVSYWHEQLDVEIAEHADTDRPDSARGYFEHHRGFDTDTVNEWRLGWAPADGGLYEHLEAEGFNADTIAATGLFCEKAPTKELWRGRYIMPYFSADGRAEYAIARCTGSKGGGSAGYDGHSEDFLAGKYAKVAHTRENVPLSEPILGLHTLEGADEVVVAEGIADAISATEAGHAVLSPVTKEFKREHFEAVVEAVETHGIERVYVVPDAEPASFSEIDSDDVPDEPEHIHEAITQPPVAPGPGGGLRTANYLVEQGIDARVVNLPRPSGGKVDLDDYIQEWGQPLEPVLRSAKPPAEHPKFEAATATQTVGEDAERSGNISKKSGSAGSGNVSYTGGAGSALFDLDVGDVNTDLEDGFRGKNPLGHPGGSENYFVVNEHPESGDLIAKDYKRPGPPRYNGVTYLLVDEDERPVEGPMGPLSGREMWVAWREARTRGLLDADDPVPTKALEHIAREHDLYDFEAFDADLDTDDVELPPKAWNRALAWVNNSWADEADVDLDEDENATSKSYRSKTAATPRTWEDIRYIYEDSKEEGRKAARELLSSRYDLMTVEETEELKLYDPETGVYTGETGALRGEIYDGLKSSWSTHELNEIEAGLRQQDIVPQRDLNGYGLDGPHICVENGVLDILNRELKDHSPEHYFVERVPVAYDPEADTEPYEEFVGDLVGREADAKALFEMVGHAITPDANERWKKFLILTGDADNGKSAFYGRVKSLLDGPKSEERNTSAVKLAKMAQNRFSIHSMYGSMANIAGEIDGKKIRNTAAIKDIPGGDVVELEPKGGESFFDTVNTTLMFAANDPPIIGERDKEAIATRIVPVELPYTFVDEPDGPDQKKAMDESALEEWLDAPEALSGLLNLALDGIERFEENGGDVSLPEPPEERLRMYERTADPMREFGERCLKNQAGDYLVKADATTVYKEFATSEGYELGSNVGSVLHDVLRGVPGLNYTESRKRQPDYADTDLRLRGWDERKNVVDRVTLTEEGFEYAKEAGIVVDEDEDEDEDAEEGPSGAVPVRHAAQSPTGYTTVTVEVLNVQQPDGKLAMKATVKDNSSAIDVKSWDNPDALAEGDTVLLKNAEVGEYDGSAELTIQEGVTEVVDIQAGVGFIDGPQPADGQSQMEAKASVTDGGEPAEGADSDDDRVMNQDIRDRIAQETTKRIGGNGASREDLLDAVSSALGVSEDRVDREIDETRKNGDIHEPMEDRFKV